MKKFSTFKTYQNFRTKGVLGFAAVCFGFMWLSNGRFTENFHGVYYDPN